MSYSPFAEKTRLKTSIGVFTLFRNGTWEAALNEGTVWVRDPYANNMTELTQFISDIDTPTPILEKLPNVRNN